MKKFLLVYFIILIPASAFSFQEPRQLSMLDAVGLALEQNPRIHAAQARIELESANKLQAWAMPKMEFAVEYEGMPSGTYFNAYESRKMIVSQAFDFPSLYYMRSRKQRSLLEYARNSFVYEKLVITAHVKTSYIDALLARDRLQLARDNLALSSGLLEKAKLRYEVGEEGLKEYLWTKLQKGRAENAVNSANMILTEAMENLSVLIAGESLQSRSTEIVLTDDLTFKPVDVSSLKNEEQFLDSHILINMNRSLVDAASKTVSLAKGSFLPGVNVAVYKHNLQNMSGFWGMEFSFSVPVWFWSDQRGQISEANANKKIAEWRQVRDMQELHADYRSALAAIEAAEKQVTRYTEEILKEAEQVFDLAELNYREGESSYIDLLLAQQILIETKTEYLVALAGYNKTIARLELAAGRTLQ